MTARKWWVVDLRVSGRPDAYIGKVEATEEEIRGALGPYIAIDGNGVVVYGRPEGGGK